MKNRFNSYASISVKKFRQNLQEAKKNSRPGLFESLGAGDSHKDNSSLRSPEARESITLVKILLG